MNKIKTANDTDRLVLALAPADEAFRQSETKWGVGRLERLVSPATLNSYKRGWDKYRVAVVDGDAAAVEALAPKMIAALRYMDAEATAAGHAPLSVDRWEAATDDGRVLVVVRTQAEAHAVAQAERDAVANGTAPRDVICWTMEELARVVPRINAINDVKLAFPGAEVRRISGVQMSENQVADWATSDPLYEVIHA